MNRQNPTAKALKAAFAAAYFRPHGESGKPPFPISAAGTAKVSPSIAIEGALLTPAAGPPDPQPTHQFRRHPERPMKRPSPPSRAMSVRELEANYERQIIDRVRLSLALSKAYPGCYVRSRRAATTGPNADLTLVFVHRPDLGARVSAVANETIERMRDAISDAEALDVMTRRMARFYEGIDEP